MDSLENRVDAVIGAHPFGRPSAMKRGRRVEWPYVPVILHDEAFRVRTEQIRKRAYATRDEAVECAQRVIERRRHKMRADLLTPRYRAFRAQYGLPQEIR